MTPQKQTRLRNAFYRFYKPAKLKDWFVRSYWKPYKAPILITVIGLHLIGLVAVYFGVKYSATFTLSVFIPCLLWMVAMGVSIEIRTRSMWKIEKYMRSKGYSHASQGELEDNLRELELI